MDNKYGELEESVTNYTIIIGISLILGCGLLGACAWGAILLNKSIQERREATNLSNSSSNDGGINKIEYGKKHPV